jgi:hypothetical protein
LDKVLLGFVVFSVCAISFLSYANAEKNVFEGVDSECREFESKVELKNGTKTIKMLDCKWVVEEFEPRHDDMITVIQTDLTDEEKQVIKDAIKCRSDPTCEQPTVAEVPEEIEDEEPRKEQRTIDVINEIMCKKHKLSESERELCRLAGSLTECDQGIKKLGTIQERRSFLLSTEVPDPTKSWDYLHSNIYLKILMKADQECQATWTHLYNTILSDEYDHKVWGVNDFQPYHGDMSLADRTYSSPDLPTWLIQSEDIRAQNTLCQMAYSDAFKKQQGCIMVYEGTYKNLVGMTTWEKRLISQDNYEAYLQYKETDGIGFMPHWIDKRSVTITGISPGAQLEVVIPRD